MANNGRVTASEVTTNYSTDLTDAQIDAWVNTATEIVDDIADADNSIDSTRLKQIELNLVRHFASAQDPRIESASRETASVTYQGETGMHLNGTQYGQIAIALDPTGVLAGAGLPSASVQSVDVRGLESDSY